MALRQVSLSAVSAPCIASLVFSVSRMKVVTPGVAAACRWTSWERSWMSSERSCLTSPRDAKPVATTAMTASTTRARVIRGDRSSRMKTKSTAEHARLERAEDDDLDPIPRRHDRGRRHPRETVRTHHGFQDGRALIAGELRAVLPAVPRKRHPEVAAPAAGVPDRLERPRPDTRPVDRAAPGHLPQRRTHEELEGHHRRHRVAGQPEDGPTLERAERDRLAGTHRDLPQVELGPALDQRFTHEVELAHRHARRRHEHVGPRGPADPLDDRLEPARPDP